MKCKYCGAEISDNVKICTECGHKVMRERSFIDPFPELDEYRRIRNRIFMVDEHSKPLNIYCYVMTAILIVILAVSLILKVKFLPITALFFIGILLLMLWANNRVAGRIRFGIARILVVAIPVLTVQAIVMTLFMSGTVLIDSVEHEETIIVVDDKNESDLYKSFLGLHVSSYDGSDIMVEEDGENGRLKVNVGIFRLCTIDDGVGIFENDTVSFNAKDPNGNQIRCCLYYDSDNSLCLEVVDSAWDVLPTGTVICGFDK